MAFDDNEKTNLLTYSQVLFDAMMKINNLSTMIYSNVQSENQVNLRNFVAAIMSFEGLCTRYLDKGYYDARNILIMNSRKTHDNYINACKKSGKNPGDESLDILQHYTTRYALLIKALDRRHVLTEKSFVEVTD
jgi:hypothetical protein